MKINGVSNSYIKNYYGNQRMNKINGGKGPVSDKVEISDIGRKLSQYESLKTEDREVLIEKLRSEVKNGTYKVSSGKIASKMIKYMRNEGI